MEKKLVKTTEKTPTNRVLLAEGNQIIQHALQLLIRELGHEVIVARTGKQALKQLYQPYEFLFIDLTLPDMNGLEIAKKLREGQTKAPADTPVVIHSTVPLTAEFIAACRELRINQIAAKLTKIAEYQKLIKLVRRNDHDPMDTEQQLNAQ